MPPESELVYRCECGALVESIPDHIAATGCAGAHVPVYARRDGTGALVATRRVPLFTTNGPLRIADSGDITFEEG
jgi:hypothetical protein